MNPQEQPNSNEKKPKLFNINLLNDLPQEMKEKMLSNWNIPEGMDDERINSTNESQINFLLQHIQEKLEDDNPGIRAEAGRVLSYLRQEFESPEDFTSPDTMKHLQSKVEGVWLEGGGKEANELYKGLKEKGDKKETSETPNKYAELTDQTNKKIESQQQQSIEFQSDLKDLINNNGLMVEGFCDQQSSEVSDFADSLESIKTVSKPVIEGIRLVSKMLERIKKSPDFIKLIEKCQDKSLTESITLDKIDIKALESHEKPEKAQEYLDNIINKNNEKIKQLEDSREKLIKLVKKVFARLARVGSSFNDILKNKNESEKNNLKPFIVKFDQSLASIFQIRKIDLSEKQKIDYDFVEPMDTVEIDDPDLDETIAEVEREGYRFNPKYSHNKDDGDVIVTPMVTAYKYKK